MKKRGGEREGEGGKRGCTVWEEIVGGGDVIEASPTCSIDAADLVVHLSTLRTSDG